MKGPVNPVDMRMLYLHHAFNFSKSLVAIHRIYMYVRVCVRVCVCVCVCAYVCVLSS